MDKDQELDALLQLQGRARAVFARAARMQDLHAQAQAQVHVLGMPGSARAPQRLAGQPPHPQQLLSTAAASAVVDTHDRLQQAAHLAQQMALADPLMAWLNSRINGPAATAAEPAPEVLDMDLTEVTPAPDAAQAKADAPRLNPPAAG